MTADAFILAATVLAWAGVAVLAFALFGDAIVQRIKRFRGTARRRCPKCFYDLSGTVARPSESSQTEESEAQGRPAGLAITCSECGRLITRERHLFRGRKRWSLAGLALVLVIAAYPVRITPELRDRGWVAAVPTTALILYLPWYDTEHSNQVMGRSRRLPPPEDLPLIDRVYDDFRNVRVRRQEAFGRFTERLLVRRCVRGDSARRPFSPEWGAFYQELLEARWLSRSGDVDSPWWREAMALIEIEFNTRDVWPQGVPIWAELRVHRGVRYVTHRLDGVPQSHGLEPFSQLETTIMARVNYGDFWRDGQTRLGAPQDSHWPTVFDIDVECSEGAQVASTHVRTFRWSPQIVIEGTIDEYLEPVRSETLDEAVAELFAPELHINQGSAIGSVRLASGPGDLERIGEVTLGMAVHVVHDGAVVGKGEAWYRVSSRLRDGEVRWSRTPWGRRIIVHLDSDLVKLGPKEIESGSWSIRLIGSPEVALRDFEATRYWAGEIELPLDVSVSVPFVPSSQRKE